MIRLASTISRSSLVGHRSKIINLSRGGSLNVHSHVRHLQTVSLQLDYYMSPQFAGVACAMTNQLYEKNGIELKFLPICPVGHELAMVRNNASKSSASEVTVGSVEQNIFIPTLYNDPSLKVKAVAAMFRRSPLCLTSLKSSASKHSIVGAHEDTVSLLERILKSGDDTNNTSVVASARSSKITDLTTGEVDRIQTYLTTEVPTLQRALGAEAIENQILEGLNGAKLGYSQMLFAPEEDLESSDKREILQSFLKATFDGWKMAISDIESAAKSVEEAKVILRLDDENNDHWESSFSYNTESVGLCNSFVKETFQGDRYGVIDVPRWNEATEWLLAGEDVVDRHKIENFGIDTDIWQPSPQLLAGNELARTTLESAKKSAEKFADVHNRKPSLTVITLGDLPRYTDSEKRLKMYSNDENSWFNKKSVGEANGFDVTDIVLPETTTTDELLSQLYALKSVDGIQLMWPLPKHIDSAKVYNAIDVSLDVDGAHYIGQTEIAPQSSPMPPVTPSAVMALLGNYAIDLKNKGVLVIGRSRIVGSPVALMLRERGAIVTVAHSEVAPEMLESLVRSADTIVSCAGSPGLLKAEWLKPGAEVINVGTTFVNEEKGLVSDFDGDLSVTAKRFSPVPGGIGPLSVAHLFQNVAEAAWNRATATFDVEATWTKKSGSLNRSLHFKDYNTALAFANQVNEMSTEMDHHANIAFSHKCVNGVDVDMEFFTYEANGVTDKDYEAARAINAIFDGAQIRMI